MNVFTDGRVPGTTDTPLGPVDTPGVTEGVGVFMTPCEANVDVDNNLTEVTNLGLYFNRTPRHGEAGTGTKSPTLRPPTFRDFGVY